MPSFPCNDNIMLMFYIKTKTNISPGRGPGEILWSWYPAIIRQHEVMSEQRKASSSKKEMNQGKHLLIYQSSDAFYPKRYFSIQPPAILLLTCVMVVEWVYYYRILQILQFYIFMAFKCQSEDSIQVMWALWTNQRPVSGHVISLWSVIYLKKGK